MILVLLYKLLLLALGFNLVVITRYLLYSVSTRRAFLGIPGPYPSSFIWGEEWELYSSLPGKPYIEWHTMFGKVVKFTGAFGHKIISVTDPAAVSFILGDAAYQFPKTHGVRAWFKATLGEGILWVEGKKAHERQRRVIAPALNHQSVRRLTDIFFEKATQLANHWSRALDIEANSNEVEIEVTNWTGRFALDAVGRAAFSYDFGCLSGEPHALLDALDGLTNNEHKRSSFYMRALFWIFPAILHTGTKGDMIRRVKREMGEIAAKMWRESKLVEDKDSQTLMANIVKYDEASPEPMDEEQIVCQMRSIISAGYETVSAVAAWMLYEIAMHPHFQDDLRAEICALPDLSFENLSSLPLLDAAFKETLRLHPAILENHHEAGETISLPLSEPLADTGESHIIIPKGTIVVIPLNVLQTDPEIWGKDADRFRPSRWMSDEKPSAVKGHVHELLSFSIGPRSCIGKTFATAEIKALVVTLLRRFSLRCEKDIEPFQSFVIRPRVKGETASSLPLLVSRI